jgi:hypothetical protein
MQPMGQDSIMMGQTKAAIENAKPKVCVSVLVSLEGIQTSWSLAILV